MPKNKTGGNKAKKGKNSTPIERSQPIKAMTPDNTETFIALVEKCSGSGRFLCKICVTTKVVSALIPGSFKARITIGRYILIANTGLGNITYQVLHQFTDRELDELTRINKFKLPKTRENINDNNDIEFSNKTSKSNVQVLQLNLENIDIPDYDSDKEIGTIQINKPLTVLTDDISSDDESSDDSSTKKSRCTKTPTKQTLSEYVNDI